MEGRVCIFLFPLSSDLHMESFFFFLFFSSTVQTNQYHNLFSVHISDIALFSIICSSLLPTRRTFACRFPTLFLHPSLLIHPSNHPSKGTMFFRLQRMSRESERFTRTRTVDSASQPYYTPIKPSVKMHKGIRKQGLASESVISCSFKGGIKLCTGEACAWCNRATVSEVKATLWVGYHSVSRSYHSCHEVKASFVK